MACHRCYRHLANEYCVGGTTIHQVIHGVVPALCDHVVNDVIKFPSGPLLTGTMAGFEEVSGLRMCAGAMGGMFLLVRKSEV